MEFKRNRNVDELKPGLNVTTLFASDDEDEVTMGIADASSIFSMLSDLSAKPGNYVLRETFTNSVDATKVKGKPYKPIEINISEPKLHEDSIAAKLSETSSNIPHLRIIDHGCGMSNTEVKNLYLQYGGSDKKNNVDAIGSKGLGSKSPLAVADTFCVTTTKDGITTYATIERKANGINTANIHSEYTGHESGTCVDVPVANPQIVNQMNEMAEKIANSICDVPVKINGKLADKGLPDKIGEERNSYIFVGHLTLPTDDDTPLNIRIWEQNNRNLDNFTNQAFPKLIAPRTDELDFLIGGIIYEAPYSYRTRSKVIAEIEPGWLDFTPSRDEIKNNEAKIELIKRIQENWSTLDHSTAFTEWLTSQPLSTVAEIATNVKTEDEQNDWNRAHCYCINTDEDKLTITYRNKESVSIEIDKLNKSIPNASWLLTTTNTDVPNIISYAKNNNLRGELYVNNRHIPLNQISKKTIPSRSRKSFVETISSVKNQTLAYIIHIDETEENIRKIMRNLSKWHGYLIENNSDTKPTDTACIIISSNTHPLSDNAKSFLNNVQTTSLEDFLKTASFQSKLERKANATARARLKSDPKKNTEWQALFGTACSIPDASTPTDNLLEAITDTTTYTWYSSSTDKKIYNVRTYTHAWSKSGDLPLKHLAIILDDASSNHPVMLTKWAALIAMARKNGVDIVPKEVNSILLTNQKNALKREVDSAILNGATILQDLRSSVKRKAETICDGESPFIKTNDGLTIQIAQEALFGDNDIDTAIYNTLYNRGSSRIGNYVSKIQVTKLYLEIMKNSTNTECIEHLINPLTTLVLHEDTTRRWYAPWTLYTVLDDDYQHKPISPSTSSVAVTKLSKNAQTLSDNMLNAIDIACEAFSPIINILGNQNTEFSQKELSQENIEALRAMIEESLTKRTLEILSNKERNTNDN